MSIAVRKPTLFFDHARAPLFSQDEGQLAGLRHRTVIDGEAGAASLALWQEEHLPGFEVALHSHDCEEIIAVIAGRLEAVIGDCKFVVEANQSILIPAGELHGFRVLAPKPIRMLAIFGSSNPKIFRADGAESAPPWRGGGSDHLKSECGGSFLSPRERL